VQCMAGDTTGARATVDAALVYAPGLEDLLRMRDQMTDCSTPKSRGAGQQ
jgi:hypothetical protein